MTEALYNAEIKRLAAAADRRIAGADSVTLDTPLCGDRATIEVAIADGRIAAIGHAVKGCMLCKAAAAALAETVTGLTPEQALAVAAGFRHMIAENGPAPAPLFEHFLPVRAYRSRQACVLLPFHALETALERESPPTPPAGTAS